MLWLQPALRLFMAAARTCLGHCGALKPLVAFFLSLFLRLLLSGCLFLVKCVSHFHQYQFSTFLLIGCIAAGIGKV